MTAQNHSHTPTLEYQSPGDTRWLVRAEADQVTLVLEGPPGWWQLTRAAAGLLVCVAIGVAFLIATWEIPWRGPGFAHESLLPLAAGGVAGIFAFVCALELRRFHRYGPARPTYHLTSAALSPNPDPQVLFGDGPDVLRVADLAPAPGRILFNARRELLLRLVLAQGPAYDVPWRGPRDELERIAEELRAALRLGGSS